MSETKLLVYLLCFGHRLDPIAIIWPALPMSWGVEIGLEFEHELWPLRFQTSYTSAWFCIHIHHVVLHGWLTTTWAVHPEPSSRSWTFNSSESVFFYHHQIHPKSDFDKKKIMKIHSQSGFSSCFLWFQRKFQQHGVWLRLTSSASYSGLHGKGDSWSAADGWMASLIHGYIIHPFFSEKTNSVILSWKEKKSWIMVYVWRSFSVFCGLIRYFDIFRGSTARCLPWDVGLEIFWVCSFHVLNGDTWGMSRVIPLLSCRKSKNSHQL